MSTLSGSGDRNQRKKERIYEHKCLEYIKTLYKQAGKCGGSRFRIGRTRSRSTLRRDRFWTCVRERGQERERGSHFDGGTKKGIDWETAKEKREEEGAETDTSGQGPSAEEESNGGREEEEESRASCSSGAEWSGASADEWGS